MTTYIRHPDLRLTALEGEGVVLHLGERRYFTVSESGLALLDALQRPATVDELVTVLTARYDVTEEKALESVRGFVDRCRGANLVVEQTGA